jgi:YggT family protein
MLTQAVAFLLETFLGLFALALLLRFYLQLLRAPARNPMSTFLAALTNWIVVPARRVIPGLFRVDLSTLVLAWLTELILLCGITLLRGAGVAGLLGALLVLALVAAVEVVKLSLYILMVAVIVQAVLSWVAPYSPAMPILNSLTRPFLLVFSKRIPPVGNVDLSPIFVIVGCQLGLFLVNWVEGGLLRAAVGQP